jgi:hypothetical protein
MAHARGVGFVLSLRWELCLQLVITCSVYLHSFEFQGSVLAQVSIEA